MKDRSTYIISFLVFFAIFFPHKKLYAYDLPKTCSNEHGFGKCTYLNKNKTYKGELKKGIPHGIGILHISENHSYKGEFTNGIINGQGVEVWEGVYTYKGSYDFGRKKYGYLEMNCPTGNSSFSTYKGEFKEGELGEGESTDCFGNKHSGSHNAAGIIDGYGETIFSNGNKYIGQHKYGTAAGKGKTFFIDGAWFDGIHKNNVPYGYGEYKFPNGERVIGKNYNGEFVGKSLYIKKNGEKVNVDYGEQKNF